ncbi:MAG: hypothetical protein PHH98_04840 [Candidatus Gracilibacteria bacterium]|nr:hypothetical protein [Candidatus Gracilibacteria bacterium]
MKKLIALLSVLALTLLVSCGEATVEENVETTSTGVEINMDTTTEPLEIDAVDSTTDTTSTGTTEETTSTGVEIDMDTTTESTDTVELN